MTFSVRTISYLVITLGCGDDGGAKTGGNAHAEPTNHAAHHDIPQHALCPVSAVNGQHATIWCLPHIILPWCKPKYDGQSSGDENGAIDQEPRRQEELLELQNLADRLFLGTCIVCGEWGNISAKLVSAYHSVL